MERACSPDRFVERFDLWLLGQWLLGFANDGERQPADWEAALVLLGVTAALCLIYLNRRTRGVEIVS